MINLELMQANIFVMTYRGNGNNIFQLLEFSLWLSSEEQRRKFLEKILKIHISSVAFMSYKSRYWYLA